MKNTKTKKSAKKKIPAPVIELDKYRKSDGHTEPVAGGQSTEHCMQFLVDCLSCIALFAASKSLASFCSPFSRTTEPPRFRQRLERNRNPSGRTPDPHRCNIDGLRPPTNRVAAYSVQMGFAGADAVPGDLKSPG